jgi:hypothetical protein
MSTELVPWRAPEPSSLPATARQPQEFITYAIALKSSEQNKVLQAVERGLYDLATEFVWRRALSRLKQTLATLGMQFVGEMLGRDDIEEFSSPEAVLTDWDAIRLAENLGVISTTGSLRLRHAFELLSHLSKIQDEEVLDETEAINIIRNCVRYVLSESDFGVAVNFSRFRDRLISETLGKEDPQMQTLLGSPPFFLKTALRVLLATIKTEHGARLEHTLSNFNLLLPEVWQRISEDDRWAVGTTYAEVANEGKKESINALRRSLLKVSGFDYVPESLRSNTFKKTAKAVLDAHFSMNNFYHELAPVTTLSKLGTVIPKPALIDCMRAYLCVYLGNTYGHSWNAAPVAFGELKKISPDRWQYYLKSVLLNDDVVLNKLMNEKPSSRFCDLMKSLSLTFDPDTPIDVKKLLDAAVAQRVPEVRRLSSFRWHRLRGETEQANVPAS